jgi:ATP/maltotriose-dependent transcriptional regulator MalT
MATPLLRTKLDIPAPRPELVPRPRLIERLNKGLHGRLTLISAPAGFGEITLVSEWVAGCERPAACLSLDQGDSDPTRFLAYIVAALQTIAANIGEGASGNPHRRLDCRPAECCTLHAGASRYRQFYPGSHRQPLSPCWPSLAS